MVHDTGAYIWHWYRRRSREGFSALSALSAFSWFIALAEHDE
jgi:hypothetical protein